MSCLRTWVAAIVIISLGFHSETVSCPVAPKPKTEQFMPDWVGSAVLLGGLVAGIADFVRRYNRKEPPPPPPEDHDLSAVPRLNIPKAHMNIATFTGSDAMLFPTESALPSAHSGLSILIVDDTKLVMLSPHRILSKSLGHQVMWAQSGDEAIELVLSRHFDLILMDHNMPELNGLETVQALRYFGIETPIVSHSSEQFSPEVRQLYQSFDVTEFVDKAHSSLDTYALLLSRLFDH